MTNKIRLKDGKFDDVFIKGICPYCGSGPGYSWHDDVIDVPMEKIFHDQMKGDLEL